MSGTRTSDHRGIHHGRWDPAGLDLASLRVKTARHQTGTEHSQDIVVADDRRDSRAVYFFSRPFSPVLPCTASAFLPKNTLWAHGPFESCSQGVKHLPTIHVNSLTVCSNEQLKVRKPVRDFVIVTALMTFIDMRCV